MLSWFARPGERAKRIDADADVLGSRYGEKAHSVAPRSEHEAGSQPMAKEWNSIVLAVAQKTHKRLGLDAATRRAINSGVPPRRTTSESDWPRFFDERSQLEELERILGEER